MHKFMYILLIYINRNEYSKKIWIDQNDILVKFTNLYVLAFATLKKIEYKNDPVFDLINIEIKNGIKSINKYGVCSSHHWIYNPIHC